ncbi:hypothetical protein J3R83DRAFT_7700, partial [Lanmaoa asiatica]
AQRYTKYSFEAGFTEANLLWKQDYRETHADIVGRVTRVLDTIFHNDREQCRLFFSSRWSHRCELTVLSMSITAYGGFDSGFLRVCHHRPWFLPTGGEYQ